MNSFLTDYYRCPAEFAQFDLAGPLGRTPGFFRFGKESICYGRCAGGVTQTVYQPLTDISFLVERRGDRIALPFDPNQVLDNLRSEQYLAGGWKKVSTVEAILRKGYYSIRPLLSVGIRKYLQRFHLRGWQQIKFPSWPVDCTVDRICADLMALSSLANGNEPIPFVWFWPEGYPSCAIVTHDIEHEPGRAFCGELMDMDDAQGVKSSFQVVPEDRYLVSDHFLESIRARGFEVNVHDLNHDGSLFEDYSRFLLRAKKINEYGREYRAEGFRSGATYRNADWFRALDFAYDMSVPSAAHLEPQQGGCCTIMPYFVGELLELPLTAIQDYSLFNILGQDSIDLWKQQIEFISSRNGLITFNIHPDYVIEPRAGDVYRSLLQYLSELRGQKRLWLPLPRDVAKWWRERSQMQVARSGNAWKIVGKGSERARLAFARFDGQSLAYSIDGVSSLGRGPSSCAPCLSGELTI